MKSGVRGIGQLLRLVRAVQACTTTEELFQTLSKDLRQLIPADWLSFSCYRTDDDAIDVMFVDPPIDIPYVPRSSWSDAHTATTPYVFTEEAIAIYPQVAALWERHGISVCLRIPLVVEGRPIGSINAMCENPRAFRDTDLGAAREIGTAVGIALDRTAAQKRLTALRDQASLDHETLSEQMLAVQLGDQVIGEDPVFSDLKRQVELVAPTAATVLLLGESGTGKDMLASAIHAASPRAARPMITLNCAALPPNLADSELFGHEPGAFTGASRRRQGKFELAHESTLFLDEVGELPLDVQAKLLRVLQERELERVGGGETLEVDVRIVSATNRDLAADVAAGRFRQDLYYRLSVFPIRLPPLRERRGDIPALVETFVTRAAQRFNVPRPVVSEESMKRLVAYDWPGNVRELQNLVERAIIISRESPDGELDVSAVLPAVTIPAVDVRDPDSMRERYIAALEGCSWVIEGANGAAAILGLHPNTLRSRLKKHGIVRPPR